MPNRAAEIRAQTAAVHPGAVVEARGDRWLRHRLPDGSTSLDVTVGRLHYDVDLEVDTDIVDATVPTADDMATAMPYEFYQRDGDRRLYPRRGVTSEYIDLGRPEFQRPNLTWAAIPWTGKSRNANVITYSRADARLEIVTGPERLKLNLVLLSLPTSTRWRFPATLVGLTRQGRSVIADSDGATVAFMAAFTLVDAAGVERAVPDQLTGHPTYQGAYLIEPDLSGLAYPVVIDPTIDVSVTANADDGLWQIAVGSFNNTSTTLTMGHSANPRADFMRFAAVNIPAGATVTTAYLALQAGSTGSATSVNVNIYAEAADNPSAVASQVDGDARALTSGVAWSSIGAWTAGDGIQTPSIVTPVQAIVNRAGWASGQAMQFFIKDNGSTASAFRSPAAIENTTYTEPILHVVYTPPAVAFAPVVVASGTLQAALVQFLAPSVIGASTATATIISTPRFTPLVTAASVVGAAVSSIPYLSPAVSGTTTVSAAVASTPYLAATVVAASSVTSSVRSPALLTATVSAAGTVTANVASRPLLSAAVVASSIVDASLGGPAMLTASVVSASSLSAALVSTPMLAAAVVAASTTSASVVSPAQLVATILSASSISAAISGIPYLSPNIVAASSVSATLGIVGAASYATFELSEAATSTWTLAEAATTSYLLTETAIATYTLSESVVTVVYTLSEEVIAVVTMREAVLIG